MLKKGLTLVTSLVRERLGTPPDLRQFLDDNARRLHVDSLDAELGNITADSIPRWHEWGDPSHSDGVVFKAGELLGWKTHRNFGYRSYRIVRPELAGFGSCLRIPGWRCNAQDVDATNVPKSRMEQFSPLRELPRQTMPGLIDGVRHARLARLLERQEVRSLSRQRSSERFVRHLWDGRVFLIDNGASRESTAFLQFAVQFGQRDAPGAELHVFSIEPQAVSSLRRDFELFAISSRDVFANVGFHDAVRRSCTPYLSKRMPQPHSDAEVIFLPRVNRRSMALAAEMRAAGFSDVGKHLSSLVLRQHMNAARHIGGQEARAA
jgi:hypothetical protein